MAIRALERSDLPDVARLVCEVMMGRPVDRTDALERHLAALFLDHPWFDPEIPSLVSTDKGGRLIAEGTPEDVVQTAGSFTGEHLAPHLRPRLAPAKSKKRA